MATLTRRAHIALDAYVVDCSWSSDSRSLAVAGGEGAIIVVDDATSSPKVRKLGEHAMGSVAIVWQPNGSTIASSGQDSTLVFWDAPTGNERKRLRPGTSWTEHLVYSPDGKTLATSAGKALRLFSPDGEIFHELAPHGSSITALGWDKAGRDLAAATHGVMWVHRVEPPKFTSRQYKAAAACLTASFSPNSKVLATGLSDGTVHFWYLATGRDSEMRGYGSKVNLTSWSSNSRYFATCSSAEIVVWDFSGKGPERSKPLQLSGHTERIDCLSFQPNGPYLISGGRDWRVALWQPGTKPNQALDVHMTDAEVSAIRWSPDGRFVAVGERQGKLGIYELLTS
jgi:WD40 repeat protein